MAADVFDQNRYRYTPWGLVLFEGVMALIFAALFLLAPQATLFLLARVAALFLLIGGVVTLLKISLDSRRWGIKLVAGVLGILAGGLIISHPLSSALALPTATAWLVGVIGIIMGVLKIVEALRGAGWHEAIIGAIYILIGVLLVTSPFMAAINLPTFLGIVALVGGLFLIYMAFRVRGMQKG